MVVKKNRSFDTRFKGDFNLNGNKLSKDIKNEFIYTGCQILNRQLFQKIHNNIFSISEIWNNLIDNNELYGYESFNEFIHLTDIEIFKKLNYPNLSKSLALSLSKYFALSNLILSSNSKIKGFPVGISNFEISSLLI